MCRPFWLLKESKYMRLFLMTINCRLSFLYPCISPISESDGCLDLGYKSFMHGVYGDNVIFTNGKFITSLISKTFVLNTISLLVFFIWIVDNFRCWNRSSEKYFAKFIYCRAPWTIPGYNRPVNINLYTQRQMNETIICVTCQWRIQDFPNGGALFCRKWGGAHPVFR